jgi:hypothetical protein
VSKCSQWSLTPPSAFRTSPLNLIAVLPVAAPEHAESEGFTTVELPRETSVRALVEGRSK